MKLDSSRGGTPGDNAHIEAFNSVVRRECLSQHWLTSPDSDWDRPVVTSLGRGSYGIRTDRWRSIRYADGSEELCDHDWDPLEWTNLAGRPRFRAIKGELSRCLGGPWAEARANYST